jgi:pimeloyl-ACP methyl ester carboxylesterase
MFSAKELSADDVRQMLQDSVSVPSYVRRGLFQRSVDNDDLLPRIRKPVLITHGAKDVIVKPSAVEKHKSRLPHAQTHIMNTGHAAFWEDAPTYNQRLHEFSATL